MITDECTVPDSEIDQLNGAFVYCVFGKNDLTKITKSLFATLNNIMYAHKRSFIKTQTTSTPTKFRLFQFQFQIQFAHLTLHAYI